MKAKTLFKNMLSVTAAAVIMGTFALSNTESVKALQLQPSTNADKISPSFLSFKGKIIEMAEFHGDESKKFIIIENEDEAIVNFVATANTYYANGLELKEGMEITGYYDAMRPVILIYPPQYEAIVFWTDPAEGEPLLFLKVERFDEDLLSYDNELKLNVSDETEIVMQNGDKFQPEEGKTIAESLAHRALAVYYDITTRSLPPQTPPKKIVVLDKAVPYTSSETATEETIDLLGQSEGQGIEIVVEGKIVGNAPLIFSENGGIMIPLYIVTEALDIPLVWEEETQTVRVGLDATLTIGKDLYTFARMAPIEIGDAPIIHNDRTYVPLSFFTKVLRMNNAYFLEGQIVIDNFEKME